MVNKRLFDLLRLRVSHSYALLSDKEHGKTTFFKESVDVLENFSNFFEDIRSHRNPVLEKFLNTSNGGHEFDQDTYWYFSKLVANTTIFPDCGYKFSQWTTSTKLMECIRNIQNASEYFLHLDENDPYAHLSPNLQKLYRGWGDTSFPASQIAALKDWIKENQTSISWNVEDDRRTSSFEHNYLCMDFDSLISQNLEVNVLCLDINLKNSFNSPEHEFIRINLDYITKIQMYLNRFPDFLNGFFKWESDHQHGLNLHCILFFTGKRKLNSKKVIEKLTESISKDKFDSGVSISNWLNLSKQITKQDFTKISYHQTEHIHQFKYWILGYYAYIDHLIKLDYKNNSGNPVPLNGDFLRLNEYVYYDPLLAYQRNIEQWKKRIEGKNPQKIWQYQNLTRDAIERITVTELVYKEYAKSDTRFADLAEVGVHLEIFIENLLASNGGLFDFPRQFNEFNPLTTDELTYSITRSCQQYFSLLDELDKIQRLLRYSCNGMTSFFLTSITIQLHAFFSRSVIEDKFNLDLKKIDELNVKSLALKKRYQVQTHQDGSLKIRTNQVSENFNRFEANITQHKICARRYVTASNYLDRIFLQNLVVYRIQFRLERIWGDLSQEEFSKLFTSFVRFAKRAKPLSMSIGYLGSWNVGYEKKTFADVLFFFPRTKLEELDEVGASIIKYWDGFLNNHIQAKINREPTEVINLTECIEIFLSQPEFSSKYVVFDANDKKKQRLFKNTIVKYLCYKEIFQPRPVKEIKKVLMKGKNNLTSISQEKNNFSLPGLQWFQ